MKKLLFTIFLSVLIFGGVAPTFAADCPAGRICLTNPLGNKTEASQIIGTIIKGVLGILGSLALFMMVWGGFQWLTSAGNKDKIDKGTKTMMWSVIGVVVILSSYILVDTVLNAITGKI